MPTQTDPARELAEICTSLRSSVNKRGDTFLAEKLGVERWSREFYQVVFTVVERADFLIEIVRSLDLDEDYREQAVSHIQAVTQAFTLEALSNRWDQVGSTYLSAENVQPIKMLSPLVRAKVSYPSLSQEELTEVAELVDTLIKWLDEHQINENDFIRQALLEGLRQLQFRLARLRWLGWGYTLESLRDVIGAYMALQGASTGAAKNPDAEAVLKKVRSFVRDFYEKTQFAKDVVETGDLMLRVYGACALIGHHSQKLAGLLPGG